MNSEIDHAEATVSFGNKTTSESSSTWALHTVVWFLLPLGIVGALVLSATATMDKAARHGVPSNIQPFAVAMLEVVSLAGTLLAVWANTRRLRRHAMVAIAASSGVAFASGISAYGWFGGIASVALVGLVHLASESWLELRDRRLERPTAVEPVAVEPVAVEPVNPTPTYSPIVRLSDIDWPKVPIERGPATSKTSISWPNEQPSSTESVNAGRWIEEADDGKSTPRSSADDADLLDRARDLLSDQPNMAKTKIARDLGVTTYRAAQLKSTVLNEMGEMAS